jgi:hypothetical protein
MFIAIMLMAVFIPHACAGMLAVQVRRWRVRITFEQHQLVSTGLSFWPALLFVCA